MEPTAQDSAPATSGYRFTTILLLVSLGLSLPALLAGYWWDDYYFTRQLIHLDAPFGYYDFGHQLVAHEVAPWWTSPDFKISFFRPLSSLTLHLDFTVWNASPLYAHLHSALWFVALLLGALRLLAALLPRREARWAAVIFALSACHAFTVGWISARHAVVGGAFSVWSLLYYIRWRQQARRLHGIVALVLFALGLLSSESALAVPALVLAYELAGAGGAWKHRLASAAPFLGLAVVYFAFYKLSGYGSYGSGLYADPLEEPVRFLVGIVPKTLSIFGTFVFGIPTSWGFMPGMRAVPLVAGGLGLALLTIGVALGWSRLGPQQRLFKWLCLATLGGLAPSMASFPQGRNTVLSTLTFAALAALLVTGLLARNWTGIRRVIPLATALLLCLGLLVLSPLLRLGLGAFIHKNSTAQAKLGKSSKVSCRRGARVILLNGGLMHSLQAPFIVASHQGRFFSGWHQLTEPATDIRVERSGDRALIISTKGKPLINEFMLRVLRRRTDDLTVGKVIRLKHLHARVLATSPRGPTRMELTIDGLDDPSRICLLTYDGERGVFKDATLPPRGKSQTIKWAGPKL